MPKRTPLPPRTQPLSRLKVETELESDGRWIAEVPSVPGALCYDVTEEKAKKKVTALALQIKRENQKPLKRSRVKRSKKTLSNNRMVKALDDDARSRCFERDGHHCVRCGKGPENCIHLQPSHIIGRRHKCTRWELDNLLSMCGGCHMWWHEYPSLSGPWFRANWPDRHERITALYNAGGKMDLKALISQLKQGAL